MLILRDPHHMEYGGPCPWQYLKYWENISFLILLFHLRILNVG